MAKKGETGTHRGASAYAGDYERVLLQEEARIREKQKKCKHPKGKCEVICMCCGKHTHVVGGRVYKRGVRVKI